VNKFVNNNDGTITDNATGLMWAKDDNGSAVNWEDALSWVQQKNSENYLGHNDWRLPNVKELQGIVDYSRSLQATNSAAIDTMFNCTQIIDEGGNKDYPFYWSSTTHANMMNGSNAAYVCFGEALGWMQDPMTGQYQLMDVHGAGAQRSDPKTGNPADYPYGHGPQGDVIRIYNYVRLVRNADIKTSVDKTTDSNMPNDFVLNQNYPNPFNPTTTIQFSIPVETTRRVVFTTLNIYDILGKKVATLVNEEKSPGNYEVSFDASRLPSGVYFYRLTTPNYSLTKKMICLK
jgi:hypothetical protein